MPKSYELPPLTNENAIDVALYNIPNNPHEPILTQLETFDDFIDAVFDSAEGSNIYAKDTTRPRDGSGPHFDVYGDHIDPEYPYVATYNRRGIATLRATALSDTLNHYYEQVYPRPTRNARLARRHLGELAFMQPDAVVYGASIQRRSGLIIPQVQGETPLVHDVSPINLLKKSAQARKKMDGGMFTKVIVPRSTEEAIKAVRADGYRTLDEYFDNSQVEDDTIAPEEDTPHGSRAVDPFERSIPLDERGRQYPGYEHPGHTVFD